MARKVPPVIGLDLFGYTRTGVQLHGGARELIVQRAWEQPIPFGTHIGGTLLDAMWEPGAVPDPLVVAPGRNESLNVGIEEVPGTIAYKGTQARTQEDVFRQFAEGQAAQSGRSELSHDAQTQQLLAIPRAHDRSFGALSFHVRTPSVLQVLDRLQAGHASLRPVLDARFLAPLRAFLALGGANLKDVETLVFSHVDLFDSLHVLVHHGSPVMVQRESTGIATFAAEDASSEGMTLDAAIERIYASGLQSASTRAFSHLMNQVLDAVRSRLSQIAQAQSMTNVPKVQRLVVSGPLTDFTSTSAVQIRAAGQVGLELFRPLAELTGVPVALLAHAGRFTVALGHALNPGHDGEAGQLAVDLTYRLSVEHLPRERRRPETVIERVVRTARPNARQIAQQRALANGKMAQRAKLAQGLYIVPLLVAAGLGWKQVERVRLTRAIDHLRADSVSAAAHLLDMQNLQAAEADYTHKQHALETIRDARANALLILDATAHAMGRSSANVWLTELGISEDGRITYAGAATSYTAIAGYYQALAADSAFREVVFQRTARADRGVLTFEITARTRWTPPLPVRDSAQASASGAVPMPGQQAGVTPASRAF